jgi:hypothetical protein
MVLIAVLFLGGTGMALAVSSSLHTVDVAIARDNVHYSAESAVARGAAGAAISASHKCSLGDAICEEPVNRVAPDPVRLLSISGHQLASGDSSFQLSLPQNWTAVWTVVGWRTSAPSASVAVWIDSAQDCDAGSRSPSASPVYVICRPSDGEEEGDATSAVLHISVRRGSVSLGSLVVRAALAGGSTIVTVVGKPGIEVDETDVALPERVVKLWNTVLP